jgi:hypothetical protein
MDPLVQAAGGAGRGGGQEGVVNGPVGEHAGEHNAEGAAGGSLRRPSMNKEGPARWGHCAPRGVPGGGAPAALPRPCCCSMPAAVATRMPPQAGSCAGASSRRSGRQSASLRGRCHAARSSPRRGSLSRGEGRLLTQGSAADSAFRRAAPLHPLFVLFPVVVPHPCDAAPPHLYTSAPPQVGGDPRGDWQNAQVCNKP